MGKATTLLVGITIGAIGVILFNRLREHVNDEYEPEALLDRLGEQLHALEARTSAAHSASSEV